MKPYTSIQLGMQFFSHWRDWHIGYEFRFNRYFWIYAGPFQFSLMIQKFGLIAEAVPAPSNVPFEEIPLEEQIESLKDSIALAEGHAREMKKKLEQLQANNN